MTNGILLKLHGNLLRVISWNNDKKAYLIEVVKTGNRQHVSESALLKGVIVK